MNASLRAADERYEVVRSAEAWHGAGAIDDATLATIRERYKDDRRRTKTAFRALFFFFTLLAGQAAWGFFAMFFGVALAGTTGVAANAMLLGFLAAGAAFGAYQAIETSKLRRFGIDEALVYLAIGFETASLGLALHEMGLSDRGLGFALCWNLAVVAALAAGRWGIAGTGALAGIGLFGALALAQLPLLSPRWLWIGAAIPLALFMRRLARNENANATHRRRADELSVVALVALYVAVHVSTVTNLFFGVLESGASSLVSSAVGLTTVGDLQLALGWTAMIALPLVLLGAGVRYRDRLDLALGTIGLLATAASAVDALDLGPPWLLLAAAGAILLAVAVGIRAKFKRSPNRTAAGFTDEPLYDPASGRSFLEIAATLAVFTPASRPVEDRAALRGDGGDGGEFGGGGASSDF